MTMGTWSISLTELQDLIVGVDGVDGVDSIGIEN